MASYSSSIGSSSGLSLAIRLRDGAEDAWRELVDLYGPLVDGWCRRAELSEAARADVTQEVFLAVHRGIAAFDPRHPRATFRGWLWMITRNAIAHWRRRQGPVAAGGTSAGLRLANLPAPEDYESWEELPETADETAGLLRRALEQIRGSIEPRTWSAFWSTAVEGRSAPEVAAQLGISPLAVRQAKSRVLRRLRQQLGDLE